MKTIPEISETLKIDSSYETVISAYLLSIRILDTYGNSIADEKEKLLFYGKIRPIVESCRELSILKSEKDTPAKIVTIRNKSLSLRDTLLRFRHIHVEQITSTFELPNPSRPLD